MTAGWRGDSWLEGGQLVGGVTAKGGRDPRVLEKFQGLAGIRRLERF